MFGLIDIYRHQGKFHCSSELRKGTVLKYIAFHTNGSENIVAR